MIKPQPLKLHSLVPCLAISFLLSRRQTEWKGGKEVWEIVARVGGRGYGRWGAWREMRGEKARDRCVGGVGGGGVCVRPRNLPLCSGVVTSGDPCSPLAPPSPLATSLHPWHRPPSSQGGIYGRCGLSGPAGGWMPRRDRCRGGGRKAGARASTFVSLARRQLFTSRHD